MTSPGRPRPVAERLLFLAYVVLALYFTAPLLATGNQLGVEDWDVLLLYHAAVIRSVYEYGALPFWNPWYCGGNVLWQNPQVALLSPVYLLALAVPLPLAMKINILLHYLTGFAGMHVLLTRGLKLSYSPAVFFLACLVTLSGGPVFRLAVGHATFLPYFLMPWLLFAFLRAVESGALRYAIAAAAILAVTVYNGGIHIAFMAGLALACFTMFAAALRRDWRPLVMLATAGALTLLFAAPKLLPVAAFVSDPRTVDTRFSPPGADMMGRDMAMRAFLDPYQYRRLRFEGQNYGWHEYGNYIGPLGALVITASFIWLGLQRGWRGEHWLSASLALTALVLLLLTFGEFASFAPYMLLRHLPIVSEFRLPSRYSLMFVLFAGAMVASVWRALPLPASGGAHRFLAIVLILSSCGLAYWNHIQFEGVFSLPPASSSFAFLARPPAPAVDVTTEGLAPGKSPMLRAMMENRSILRCYEPLRLPGGIDATRPPVFGEDGVRIADVAFAPGRIEFRALSGAAAGRVFLNERYVQGWRSDAGDFTLDPDTGLAYVGLPPGIAGRFTFRFVPPWLATGMALLAIGIILAVVLWRRELPAGSMVQFRDAV